MRRSFREEISYLHVEYEEETCKYTLLGVLTVEIIEKAKKREVEEIDREGKKCLQGREYRYFVICVF